MRNRLFKISLAFVFAVLFASCASHPRISIEEERENFPTAAYIPSEFEWQRVQEGIERFDFENPEFPVIYHAVKIDLTTPGLKIVCLPDAETVKKQYKSVPNQIPQPFVYRGMTTLHFAQKHNCVVAMNGSPFGGKNGKWDVIAKLGSVRQVVGVHLADGVKIAGERDRYAAMGFKKETDEGGKPILTARIVNSQNEAAFLDCDYAFGGFFTVLENYELKDFSVVNHDSRSGAGLSQDGRTLYLLVVEGERQKRSEGLSYPQCAQIFAAMGCANALEFDGGGSSQLCIQGKSVLSYNSVRVQGNSFGFVIAQD